MQLLVHTKEELRLNGVCAIKPFHSIVDEQGTLSGGVEFMKHGFIKGKDCHTYYTCGLDRVVPKVHLFKKDETLETFLSTVVKSIGTAACKSTTF